MQLTDARSAAPAARHDTPPPGAFWVFAYGSLIWNPGFPFSERRVAVLGGYHRRFCIRSTGYRGTPETPGLVLGLDRGGRCSGIALLVPAAEAAATLVYLDQREIPVPVYSRRLLPVRLRHGPRVQALTYVARRDGPSYCRLDAAETAARIARARGNRGSNLDYLLRTLDGLHQAGISDAALENLARNLPKG